MIIDNEKDTTKIVSMTRFEFQMELDKAKLEQKAIDDEYWTDRFNTYAKEARALQESLIDKACKAHCEYCDHTCPRDGKCYILEYIRKATEE